jgi:hypothetical protein
MAAKPNRGIDHLVLCTRNLEGARRTYTRLGFTLTPHAVHPWGTGNSLVQLEGSYLELLGVEDPTKIVPDEAGKFSFGRYNAGFLARREGFSMIACRTDDARRDHDEFTRAGLTTYPPFDFSRKAKQPDGSEATVAFTLVFVTDPRLPEAVFFVCQHHAPQYFWKPEYQRHANGAVAAVEAVMVAERPAALMEFFQLLQGRDAVQAGEDGLAVTTSHGLITVLTPEAAAERFAGLPLKNAASTPHFVGYRVSVRDLEAVKMRFDASDVNYRAISGAVQIAPDIASGTYLELAAV